MMDSLQVRYQQEVRMFLILSNTEDQEFLSIPKCDRTPEAYVRLISINAILGFKSVVIRLMAEAEDTIDQLMNYFRSARYNFLTIKKWMDDFILQIKNPKLKQFVAEHWAQKQKSVDFLHFNLGQLM